MEDLVMMHYFLGLEVWKMKRCREIIWHDGMQILGHPDGIELLNLTWQPTID